MKKWLLIACIWLLIGRAFAAEHSINLTIDYKNVSFAGMKIKAMAINGQIPAPTLHFREGDRVTIHVRNQLSEETALHWHGLLVPWQMDGVLGITQHGIPPGGEFNYQFTLRQSGTYWYHAHAGLQEQQGLYGAFIIDPKKPPTYHYNKDYTIVLSDWSNTAPEQILANLKKSGDYYGPRFPLQPSLQKFIHDYKNASAQERQALLSDYKSMQQMRMSIYDLSDVAYDAFLLNGHPPTTPWTAKVKVGDTVRLRFIGAAADTIFYVKIPGSRMIMVHVNGNDVRPYALSEFNIAPGETYDVLVKITKDHPYLIYAEAKDKVGSVFGALLTHPMSLANITIPPFPEPPPVTREMMDMMMGNMQNHEMDMDMPGMQMHDDMKSTHSMDMDMSMPTESSRYGDSLAAPESSYTTSKGTKYQPMVAAIKTNDPNKPVSKVINMELFGYMDRFVWFINGLPEYNAPPIRIEAGKRYRLVFTNTSMMHHPMHIHGHWFILRKGNGAYDPLLHTIDIPPGATITVDLDADASGQWFFHCHLLYHMISGMSRVFQYSSIIAITQDKMAPQHIVKKTAYHNRPIVRIDEVRPIDVALVRHPMAHPMGYWFATDLDVGIDPFNNTQRLTYKGLYGSDYNKLELFTNDAEIHKGTVENADIDIFYWRLISQFWAIKGGVNYTYRPAITPYWQPGIGIEGTMPYFIETDVRAYYKSGSAKLDIQLERDTQITNNFFIRLGVRSILASKTVNQASIGSGLNQMRYALRPYYRLAPGLNIFAEYEHEHDYGVFNQLQRIANEQTVQNTYTFGINILF